MHGFETCFLFIVKIFFFSLNPSLIYIEIPKYKEFWSCFKPLYDQKRLEQSKLDVSPAGRPESVNVNLLKVLLLLIL